MKVLITGCDGQLGNEIIKSKPNGISLISTNRENFDLKDISKLLDEMALRDFKDRPRPNEGTWYISDRH